jgi:tRNA1(Val) A37 N6-methylase TrmN6
LTLIWRADGLSEVLAALDKGFGGIAILPVHPKPGAAAIRVLVAAQLGSRAPSSILPGLILSDDDGLPTQAAEAVLRHGQPLAWAAG